LLRGAVVIVVFGWEIEGTSSLIDLLLLLVLEGIQCGKVLLLLVELIDR